MVKFGRRKRWGEKISFKAWPKFSCALVVSVKQISGPLLLYDDRVYRWVSSSRTNQIVGGSPPRPNIESTVALLLDDDESNRRWLFSSTRNQIIGGFCRGGSIRMLLLLKSKGTLNDINVLDRSPVFDDIIKGQAPQVTYYVNGREYHLAYYLTDDIYPKWATFIQSISLPQGPKAQLFAQRQEAVRKDVERAFGVLQARFAIVKNPAFFWDKVKIGKIMRACIILHNMIVEDERDGYTQFDVSEFQQGEDNGSSHVDLTYSTDMPKNITNMMGVRTRIRDRHMHQQLKDDLVEHVWFKFGRDEDNN
uniref:DDE Tnp4 domain-containing protein n=1 Tax=Brassica oleracea var. oleracea TaxID=109376 RepID=A0A0D3BLZ0_BRAOL